MSFLKFYLPFPHIIIWQAFCSATFKAPIVTLYFQRASQCPTECLGLLLYNLWASWCRAKHKGPDRRKGFYCLCGVNWPLSNQANKQSHCSEVRHCEALNTTTTDKLNELISFSVTAVCLSFNNKKKILQKPACLWSKGSMGNVVLTQCYDDRSLFWEGFWDYIPTAWIWLSSLGM